MVPEARLEETPEGLKPAGAGWFVMNAQEAAWRDRPGRGRSLPLGGWSEEERRELFPQLGMALYVLEPGEPIGVYHWEADQEGFLVLYGQALLLVEGQERELRQWDFVHCPPGAKHIIIGAGDGPCGVLAVSSREHIDENVNGGGYAVDETAKRHGVSVEEETSDVAEAYARFDDPVNARYREGWLPG
jgi:quercetin dioxygenase-like cupin family protein